MDPTTWAARTPHAPAITLNDHTVTYAELAHRAARIAYLLRVDIGLAVGDHIALCAHNCIDYLAVTWAAQLSGLHWTTVSPSLSVDEVAYVVNDCGAQVVFASSAVREPRALIRRTRRVRRRLSIGGELHGHEPLDWAIAGLPPLILDGREGAMSPYTAGTTGRPKGIVRPLDPNPIDPSTAGGRHRDVLEHDLRVGPGSVFAVPAPLHHTASVLFAMAAQRLGAHVVLMERFDAESLMNLIEDHRVTHVYLVPQPMMTRLLALPAEIRARCERMPHVLHTAAPCPPEVKDQMLAWCVEVTEYFATSEGLGYSVIGGDEWRRHRGSVGRPRGCEVHVLDVAGTELPPGQTGRLWFSAPGGGPLRVGVSYRNDPAATEALYDGRGWGSVGDLGWRDDEGYIYVTGRTGNMIISGGVNIYPRKVEEALIRHPKVLDVVVLGVPDPTWGQRVEAVVQVPSPMDVNPALEAELLAFAGERISPFERPRGVRFVTVPLHDETGKLRQKVLDRLAGPGPELGRQAGHRLRRHHLENQPHPTSRDLPGASFPTQER
jgi:acyl-CoA synthetase (AMP-forming)/AMP-acid ligase II